MRTIVRPADLPRYVPGEIWLDALNGRWSELSIRGYKYQPSDVTGPRLSDYLIVLYTGGPTRMSRQVGGARITSDIVFGDTSLLTRSVESEWCWKNNMEVLHIYLDPGLVQRVANAIFDQDIADVHLRDVLKVRDDVLTGMGHMLIREASSELAGTRLYAESIGHQICIHLLRNYAGLKLAGPSPSGKISHRRISRMQDFIEEHLGEDLTLVSLADVAGVSACHFGRLFRNSVGVAPHQYLLQRRLDRARHLLQNSRCSIAEIASLTGFSDQSHMTRHFKRRFGVTPQHCRRRDTGFASGSSPYALPDTRAALTAEIRLGGAADGAATLGQGWQSDQPLVRG
jgi:AraC family transcriptional regulator